MCESRGCPAQAETPKLVIQDWAEIVRRLWGRRAVVQHLNMAGNYTGTKLRLQQLIVLMFCELPSIFSLIAPHRCYIWCCALKKNKNCYSSAAHLPRVIMQPRHVVRDRHRAVIFLLWYPEFVMNPTRRWNLRSKVPPKIPAIKVMVLTEAEDDKLGPATHKTQKEFVVLNDLDTGHSKWLNWHFSWLNLQQPRPNYLEWSHYDHNV